MPRQAGSCLSCQTLELSRMKVAAFLFALAAVTVPAYSADVIAELSRRSHISQPELNELLSDCTRHQLSMNICAFRDFIAADLEMQTVLSSKLSMLPKRCHSTIEKRQARWEEARDLRCNKEADAEAEGGSMRPMIYSGCRTEATMARVALITKVPSCAKVP